MSDPSRYRVLGVLLEGHFCVSEIATRIGLSQSCTTRHLQTLQRAGVLTRTRVGKRVLFQIREGDAELDRILELLVLRRPLDSTPAPGGTSRARPHRASQSRLRGASLHVEGASSDRAPAAPRRRRSASSAGETSADAVSISSLSGGTVVTDSPMETDSPSDSREADGVVADTFPPGSVELEDFLL